MALFGRSETDRSRAPSQPLDVSPRFMSILPPKGSVRAFAGIASRAAPAAGPKRRATARLVIAILLSTLSRMPAQAQEIDPSRTPPAAALEHYNRGRAHYQAGRYRQAVVELERALELDPTSPNLMYNLARVHELLGDIERAIGYYERYREMLPPSEQEERQRVAGVIARLRGAKQHVVRPSAPAPPPPVAWKTERGVADAAFWTVATLSAAALVAGAVTGRLALREERNAQNFVLGRDGTLRDRDDLVNKTDRLALASDGSFLFGAVSGLTAILLYALRSKPVVQPSVALGPSSFSLTLRGEL